MGKVFINEETLTNIGNAIREKTGKTDLIPTTNMAAEIALIQAGGGTGGEDTLSLMLTNSLQEFNSDTVEQIKNYAFYKNEGLRKVNLPNCSKIGGNCFSYNTSLEEVYFDNLITISGDVSSAFCFENCYELTIVHMPKLTEVKAFSTFAGCSKLSKIELPSLQILNKYFFRDCTSLNTFILSGNTVASMTAAATDVFKNTPIIQGTGYVYVPSALLDQYKTATNWAAIADQIRAIEDYPEIYNN